jgi:geranylgeranyl diphosphate synthase type II
MIGGQHVDTKRLSDDLEAIHRLKTGRLFYAPVACALWVAEVPEREQVPWREFADELGMLFQVVDDILDGDGYVLTHGVDGARQIADEAADRAQRRLQAIEADTSVLEEIVAGLATRTA